MNFLKKNSYLFFLLTYVLVFIWLYAGVSQGYSFCLSPKSWWNALALLAGASGVLTLVYYARHERSASRILGTVTFLIGISAAFVAVYRFFFAAAGLCV